MLLKQRTEYSRYYGDFRGVDFSTDHTLVSDSRFPYAVNMYKDYVSGAGQGIETIPGFRRRFVAPNGGFIYGIHPFKDAYGVQKVLVHAGNILYEWASYGKDEADVGITPEMIFTATALYADMGEQKSKSFIINNRLYIIDGKNYLMYDGEKVSSVTDAAYVPTTYINIIPAGENADIGTEYEQRNMLSPYFKHTFIAVSYTDSEGNEKCATEFCMNEPFDEITEVKVYGKTVEKTEYTVNAEECKITFKDAPQKPEDKGYPEFHAGIEITAKKALYDAKDVEIVKADGSKVTLSALKGYTGTEEFHSMIRSATICSVFDNRVFLSGIVGKPNLILYCERNSMGCADPSYFGILNYIEDGIGTTPITAMLPVANTLLVLKNDTQQDGSVYYHSALETGYNILPKIYPSEAGLAGTGCLGAACNFLDDPVFISSFGVDAIGQLSVRYERAREHRSSLIDAKLGNGMDLSKTSLSEWGGYLIVLNEGRIFMADSRQIFQNAAGNKEYEWFYLEDIGVYEGQTDRFFYLYEMPSILKNQSLEVEYNGKKYAVELATKESSDVETRISLVTNSILTEDSFEINYDCAIVEEVDGYHAYLCESIGEKTGGTFHRAVISATIGDNLFFGTDNGVVCSFNFDKRSGEEGMIDPYWYTFDGRAIYSGCALKMDNCGIPHMTKNSVKRSLVVKAKSFSAMAAKIRVRTNKKAMREVARIHSYKGIFGVFSEMDFSDFAFASDGETLFAVMEKEKKWVEKQFYIYSDEYKKPFSLFYLCYKYTVAGRYKG